MPNIVPKQAVVIAANNAGWEIEPDKGQWTNRIKIKSETSDNLYIVAQHKTRGDWGCSCFAWKRYRHCKHLDKMLPVLLTDQRSRP
jgi:hypothetical protein